MSERENINESSVKGWRTYRKPSVTEYAERVSNHYIPYHVCKRERVKRELNIDSDSV